MTNSSSGISNRSQPLRLARVEPLWRGQTCVCAGSGPSLRERDLLDANDRGAKLIVVNDAVRLAPWADVLYVADAKWWDHWLGTDEGLPTTIYTIDPAARDLRPQIHLLNYKSGAGLSLDPTTVMTGGHGGYQALNLAAHFRPWRILLLGYDMQPAPDGKHHFFGNHPDGSHVNYAHKLGVYHSLVQPLSALNIEIINCSRVSAIDAFPRMSLADALRL